MTIELGIAATCSAIASFCLVRGVLGARTAAFLAIGRVIVPLVYFSWFYDGSWTFLDDVTYVRSAEAVLAAGYGPIDSLLEPNGRDLLYDLSLGRHILYTWWNVVAAWLFGESYHSAVFLNIALTFGIGRTVFSLGERIGADRRLSRIWTMAFLLHPDVVAWSSFVNLKDFTVMALTALALLAISRIGDKRGTLPWLSLLLSAWALTYVRYYVLALICVAWAGSLLLARGGYYKLLTLPLAAACYYWLVPLGSEDLDMIRVGEIAYGTVHVLLTPQPWNVDPEFGYLVFPSAFHWALFGPLCIGAVRTWRSFPRARILVVYFATICLFYGSVPELQGPRHRLQVVFIGCFFQICGVLGAKESRRPAAVLVTRRAWEGA